MDNKNKLIDPFGRVVDYLRVSVTDRCDFRCTYCMAEDMQFLPKKDILSLEEIEEICKVFMKLGTKKIRLTGGEPLVRKSIMQVINNLGKEVGKGLDELTLTTNGTNLAVNKFSSMQYSSNHRKPLGGAVYVDSPNTTSQVNYDIRI